MNSNNVVSQFLAENELIEHELLQGTPEWDAFRLEHDGASEAAPMLGLSKKAKRTELLHMKHTGIPKEFSDWLRKNVLDYGHEVEAMARPIVEGILGRKLYPVVCSRGRISASCDGRTAAGDTVWEHKQWNAELAESVSSGILPDEHKPQCYQNLLVTGADRLIFTVSDGTEENMVSLEVMPDAEWFARIILGWQQFHKDLAAYISVEIKEMPKAEITIDLPALFVHAKGEITTHNMDEFGKALAVKLAETRAIALVTDQDFSNAKEAAKKFRDTAKAIKLSKEQMLAQTETIGEAARKMDAWAEDLNKTALQLEKDVEREDKAKKEVMVLGGKNAYAEHVAALEEEIKPIRMNLVAPNFAEAIKGKRNYASMQDAVDTMLAGAKVTADSAAKDVRAKTVWYADNNEWVHTDTTKRFGNGRYCNLFHDMQQIMEKPFDDFTLTITSRIEKAKADEDARMEAERARIEAEAMAKAVREAEAKLAEETARIRAEERARAEQNAKTVSVAAVQHEGVVQEAPTLSKEPAGAAVMPSGSSATGTKGIVLADRAAQPARRPTMVQMIEVIALHYSVAESTAQDWLQAEFAEVSA